MGQVSDVFIQEVTTDDRSGQVTGQAQCKREAIGKAGRGGVNHCGAAGRNSNHSTKKEYLFLAISYLRNVYL